MDVLQVRRHPLRRAWLTEFLRAAALAQSHGLEISAHCTRGALDRPGGEVRPDGASAMG